MIAVDTSALMAIALGEPQAAGCREALETNDELLISAVTVAEVLIVAARRGVGDRMEKMIAGFGFRVIEADAVVARRAAGIYNRWGKGVHPAALNFCDCFAYDTARQHDVGLLFVGDDFSRTDVGCVL